MTIPDQVYAQFTQGSADAARILVEAYQRELYNLCFRLTLSRPDAEDLFQSTWMKAIRAASAYDHRAFRPWLFQICVNLYRDQYRRSRVAERTWMERFSTTEAKDLILEESQTAESAETAFHRHQERLALMAAVQGLPEIQKTPLVLYYYQGMAYDEIAQLLGIPLGTVKSRMNTAKKTLRTRLKEEDR